MMLPSEWDIATIGAGPGRLFMANLMGLSGHRVVLLERNKGLLDMLHEQTKLAPLPSRAATLRNAPMQIAVCVMFLPQAQRAAPAIENLVAEQMARPLSDPRMDFGARRLAGAQGEKALAQIEPDPVDGVELCPLPRCSSQAGSNPPSYSRSGRWRPRREENQ